MRVGSTGPVIYLTGRSRTVTGQTCLDTCLGRLVDPWSYFSQDDVLSVFFTGIMCSVVMWCAREK